MQTYPCTMGPPPSSALSEAPSKYAMDTFSPVGLHVLVVDDDPLCLLVLERMLKSCSYKVTTCNCAKRALDILRDSEDEVDLVLSDVYMPGVDGFKLLEIIGLELDLPVIMMSANGDTGIVMKGITHGACDYLIKPVRIQELTNIWQHVVRKKGTESYNLGPSNSTGSTSSGEVSEFSTKKRKEVYDLGEGFVEDASSPKRARVNWTVDLHQRFVIAVNELGVEKAVPKKVLQVMNVKGLTRENVASHLQKYRLYLKRLSGVMPERCPIASFQASGGGKSGGTMRVLPGGRISKPLPTIEELSRRARITDPTVDMQKLDVGASQQQQQRSANRAQVLDALGYLDSRQGEVPQGNASFDLRPFLQVPQNPLFSSHSMPSSLGTLAHGCSQSREQGLDEEGATSKKVQLEGFVSNWNINPVGKLDMRSYTASSDAEIQAHLPGSHANLISGDPRRECSEVFQAARNIEIHDNMNTSEGMPSCALTTEMDREANSDVLNMLPIPEQLSLSDYLMNEDFPFDDQGFGFLSL